VVYVYVGLYVDVGCYCNGTYVGGVSINVGADGVVAVASTSNVVIIVVVAVVVADIADVVIYAYVVVVVAVDVACVVEVVVAIHGADGIGVGVTFGVCC